jgi:hypothetical protein
LIRKDRQSKDGASQPNKPQADLQGFIDFGHDARINHTQTED